MYTVEVGDDALGDGDELELSGDGEADGEGEPVPPPAPTEAGMNTTDEVREMDCDVPSVEVDVPGELSAFPASPTAYTE